MKVWISTALLVFTLVLQTSISPAQDTLVTTEPKDIYPFAIDNRQNIQGQFEIGTNLAVIEREGGWLKVKGYVGNKECIGWIKSGGLIANFPSGSSHVGYAVTEDFPVYLREADYDYAPIVCTIPSSSVVGVVYRKAKWYGVKFLLGEKIHQGWIPSSQARFSENVGSEIKKAYETHEKRLEETRVQHEKRLEEARVQAEALFSQTIGYALTEDFPVYLREADKEGTLVIYIIPNSSVVRVFDKKEKWYRVEVLANKKSLQGWIPSSHAWLSENVGEIQGKTFEAVGEIRNRIIAEKEAEKQRKEAEKRAKVDELKRQAEKVPESNYEKKIAIYSQLSEIDPANTSHKEMIQLYTDKKAAREQEKRRKAAEEERQERLRAEQRSRAKEFQEWSAKIDALPYSEDIKSLVRRREIRIGMAADAVLLSWGQPDDKNTTVHSLGKQEQWIYRKSDFKADYLYFDNGILRSFQLQGR